MLSKSFLNLRSNVSRIIRSKRMSSSSNYVSTLKEPHMNDIPVPHEPFEVGYKRRQVGNNFVLAVGIIFFTFSAAFVINSGVIYPNFTPPMKNEK